MKLEEMGKRLKKIRDKKELSRRQLADMTKVSQATLVKIEAGQRNPSIGIVVRLADKLDMSIDELVLGLKKAS